jgi:hypothetical protein
MKACPQLFGPIGVALTCLGISAVSVADAVERVGLVYSADRSPLCQDSCRLDRVVILGAER